jgi:TonB family protein
VATDIKTIADSMLEKAHSQLNQAVTWSADRAAMFQQLVDRARKIKNDLRVKGEIGTVAPLDVNAHQGTLDKVEASATADRKRSVTSVSESEINLVKTQFSAAVRVLDGVEKKFDVGLSSVQELDDALMGALLVLDPAARGGVRHQVRLMATGLPAPVSGPVRHDQQHEPYQAQATSEDSTAVLVDVLVKDAAGAILPGLKPDEFHVFEDGAEQKIAAVTLIDGTKPYYIVSYTPPARPAGSNAKPQYHTIEVRVSRSGATVIARKGYFDGEGRGVEAVVALPPDDEIFAEGAHRPGEKGAKAPVLFADPKPMYTPDAIRAKIQGTVTVEAIVDLDGTIKKARVIKSLDKEYGLDDQALQAARRWEFAPGTIDGKPARFVVTFDLTFTLR